MFIKRPYYFLKRGYVYFLSPTGKQIPLHRRIVENYIGRKLKPNELVIHLNGDKTDNRIENLEIVDRREYMRGLRRFIKNSLRKELIELIRLLKEKGYSNYKIAKVLNISPTTAKKYSN